MSLASASIEGAEQPGPETAQGCQHSREGPTRGHPSCRGAPDSSETTKGAKSCGTYKFPTTLQHHRPLSSEVYSISTFARESLRHALTAGMASTQGHKMAKQLHTQLGVMTPELHKVHKLQQKQTDLLEQLLEL